VSASGSNKAERGFAGSLLAKSRFCKLQSHPIPGGFFVERSGEMFSQVNGGLANGYLAHNNYSTTSGVRFRF
jgi:hypothetical protein